MEGLRSISSCILGLQMQTKWTRFIPELAHSGQQGEVTNISEGASNETSKVKCARGKLHQASEKTLESGTSAAGKYEGASRQVKSRRKNTTDRQEQRDTYDLQGGQTGC